ncbi:hypothetical protein CC80DRAFT_544775 [Byssothecium circinans]|uniref:Uncharacterized protein n=1 Tax=Byssothecium circinans TaxID=147558 RepID=A0A6A5U8K9_9PLEO|nr:hypothetical protein CC80DRAFT_544775 [Byssothecium circinans]
MASRALPSSPALPNDAEILWMPSSPLVRMNDARQVTSRGRAASPAPSDNSELSWPSRSPSPPSGALPPALRIPRAQYAIESRDSEDSDDYELPPHSRLRSSDRPKRGSHGRFVPALKKKRSAPLSLEARTPKRQKVQLQTPPETPKKGDSDHAIVNTPIPFQLPHNAPSTHAADKTRPTCADTAMSGEFSPNPFARIITPPPPPKAEPTGLGKLECLPAEIRQMIYGYALDIDNPVTVKECCGPTSTKRERDACKKHGKSCYKKYGQRNGPSVERGASEACGKFSVLALSKQINEEAAWVLFNTGKLVIKVGEHLGSYVNGKDSTMLSIRHLPNLPENEHVQNMWMTAARFRDICFELPATTLKYGDPKNYTARLSVGATLLMKAWELQPNKPTSLDRKPRAVTINLGGMYKTVPLNAETYEEEFVEWAQLHYPFELPNADDICFETSRNLERMIEVVSRHRGSTSKWTIAAAVTLEDGVLIDEDGSEMESGGWLYGLQEHCNQYHFNFATV